MTKNKIWDWHALVILTNERDARGESLTESHEAWLHYGPYAGSKAQLRYHTRWSRK